MRIVFVISHLICGGAETQLITLARELTRRRHAVAIYTLNGLNPCAVELEGSTVELVADQKRYKLDWTVVGRLHRFLKTYRADIVHGFLFDGDFYSRLAAFGTRAVAINSERNDNYTLDMTQKISHYFTRFLTRAVVANTHAGARFAQKLFGLSSEHIHTVWNGIDVTRMSRRAAAYNVDIGTRLFGVCDCKIACLVGSIKPSKDYDLALRVANELTNRNRDWRVVFVGEQLSNTGDYKNSIMHRYNELTLNTRAVFMGLREDVPEIISQCRVLFSTSKHEGFPNVVLEAMAVGTPVVSTDYSDIREILPEPWQVVPDREPASLVEAIFRADEKHDVVAAAQRAWILENATVPLVTAKLEAIYLEYITA